MVTNSRAPSRPDQLRPLNLPRPITVQTRNNLPVAISDRGQQVRIVRIQDVWCIDDEWWRDPIARRYYQVVIETGALRTIYHDLIADTWFEQRY